MPLRQIQLLKTLPAKSSEDPLVNIAHTDLAARSGTPSITATCEEPLECPNSYAKYNSLAQRIFVAINVEKRLQCCTFS